MSSFNIQHYAVLVASIIGLVGPDVVSHLSGAQTGLVGQIVGAVIVLASAVKGIMLAPPAPASSVGVQK